MRTKTSLQSSWIFIVSVLVLLGCFSVTKADAQISAYSGQKAICYNSSGTASNCSIQTNSPAVIDASVFSGGTTHDACLQIRTVFVDRLLPATGGVIDARGATPGSGNTFSCSDTPWFDGTTTYTTPAEILLPAGQINITEPWVLPSGTRVMGAGVFGGATENGVPVTANGYGTTLRTCTIGNSGCNLVSGNPIIQFGGTDTHGNNFCTACMGISAEYLTLDGADNTTPNSLPQNLVGILNQNAQNGSYVDQVAITYIGGTLSDIGLQIGPAPCSGGCSINAVSSGPYTNIFFTGKGSESTCVAIYQSGTLGLHGITCTGNGSSAPAIYLDASNTTIEDAHIEDSRRRGRVYLGTTPSKKRVQRICRAISDETGRDTAWQDSKTVVDRLNRMLIGWANYFCLGPVSKAYSAVDMHAHRRLRRWLCDKHKEPRPAYQRFPEASLNSVYGLVQLPHRTANHPWANA
jgi:hypothetical protein